MNYIAFSVVREYYENIERKVNVYICKLLSALKPAFLLPLYL